MNATERIQAINARLLAANLDPLDCEQVALLTEGKDYAQIFAMFTDIVERCSVNLDDLRPNGPLPTAQQVAAQFCRVLRGCLSAEDFAECVRRNATPEYAGNICASHDFCDANEVMLEAFIQCQYDPMQSEPEFNQASGGCISDESLPVWNEAWTLAKAANFNLTPAS